MMRCLLIATLSACSPEPALVSALGVEYYGDVPWSLAEIDRQEAGWLSAIDSLGEYPEAAASLDGAQIAVHPDEPFDCGGVLANGCNDGRVSAVRGIVPIGHSAVTHELAHWLDWTIGRTDYAHEHYLLWLYSDAEY